MARPRLLRSFALPAILLAALLLTGFSRADMEPLPAPFLIADINVGGDSYPYLLVADGRLLYFFAFDGRSSQLWRGEDGRAGAEQVTAIGEDESGVGRNDGLLPVMLDDGTLVFGVDPQASFWTNELWRLSGDTGEVERLQMFDGPLSSLAAWDGAVYAGAATSSGRFDLWRIDAATGARQAVAEEVGQLVFLPFGGELYASVETGDYRRVVEDTLAEGFFVPAATTPLIELAGHLYFGTASGLWRTAGPGSAVEQLQAIEDPFGIYAPRAVGGRLLYFLWDGGERVELWSTNGEAGNALRLRTFADVDLEGLLVSGGLLLFTAAAQDPPAAALWKSDGTAAGTTAVKDLYPGERTRLLSGSEFAGRAFFFAAAGAAVTLWASDGGASGTQPVMEITPDLATTQFRDCPCLAATAGRLYFTAEAEEGVELWAIEGPGERRVFLPWLER